MGNCCCQSTNKVPGKDNDGDGESLKLVITASQSSCHPVTEKKKAPTLLKPVKKEKSPSPKKERRDTNENQKPSGLDFEQYDYPEDESFDQAMTVEEVLQGIQWFPRLQIELLNKKRKQEKAISQIVEKLEGEMKQTEYVLYTEFRKEGEDENFNIEHFGQVEM